MRGSYEGKKMKSNIPVLRAAEYIPVAGAQVG
jgi:hypothetical protein